MTTENPRKYGKAPFKIAVVHGGPGAPGEMAPLARRLSTEWGILEPLQTATSFWGQIDELAEILEKHVNSPVTLIGYSWGSWLSYVIAAKFQRYVGKLILIGSGPFEEKYASDIMKTRLSRLSEQDKTELRGIINVLDNPGSNDRNKALTRLGDILSKADTFKPITGEVENSDKIECDADIFQNVWKEAAEFRKSGRLLEFGQLIQCPVVAIHGDYDPHPAKGVNEPLSRVIDDFKFILIKKCGHKPWIERYARDKFYQILLKEIV